MGGRARKLHCDRQRDPQARCGRASSSGAALFASAPGLRASSPCSGVPAHAAQLENKSKQSTVKNESLIVYKLFAHFGCKNCFELSSCVAIMTRSTT